MPRVRPWSAPCSATRRTTACSAPSRWPRSASRCCACSRRGASASRLGIDAPLSAYFAFIPIILLVMLLPITVYGLGTSQAAFVLFFDAAGVAEPAAFALSVLFVALGVVGNLPGGLLWARSGLTPPTAPAPAPARATRDRGRHDGAGSAGARAAGRRDRLPARVVAGQGPPSGRRPADARPPGGSARAVDRSLARRGAAGRSRRGRGGVRVARPRRHDPRAADADRHARRRAPPARGAPARAAGLRLDHVVRPDRHPAGDARPPGRVRRAATARR